MIDTIMDGAKCVNLQDNFSLSNFQHDYATSNLSLFGGKCFIKETNGHLLHQNVWVPLKLGALGFQKLGLIEMQFNSNQIYLSIYASHMW